MSNNNKEGDGGAIILILLVVVAVVIAFVLLTITVGALYGGGKAIYNYGVAFSNNVSLEKPAH